ncbi:MAG: helix-turn-helix transcriptional regulator [Rhizobacter sp.]|nr:helix-turn-helix transcriptional regulator [Chlorobiales bacterium]
MKNIFPLYGIGDFINEPMNPTEFEITSFGDMQEPNVEDPHKHTFYEVIWIEKGVSTQVIDYKEYTIAPRTLFFISPGQVHHFGLWQQLKGGSIFFTEDFFLLNHQNKDKLFELGFLDNFYANPLLELNKKNYAEITHTINLLLSERRRKDYSPAIAQSLLHLLLAQIQRCVDAQNKEIVPKTSLVIYKKFKSLLDSHFKTPLKAGDYAARLHISPHHLNHIIKQLTGKTATEVIRARNILEAKRLLTFTNQTVSEVASQLNFFDSSYFAKLFKSETGMSPVEFKKSISEKYRTR